MVKHRLLLLVMVAAAMALIGCGGGGGGLGDVFSIITTSESAGNQTGGGNVGTGTNLVVQTRWSGQNATPIGLSQRITISDPNGTVLATRIVEESGDVQNVTFQNVPTGYYEIRSELYSGSGASGTLTGYLELQRQGSANVSTVVGAPLADLLVTPSISIRVGQTYHVSVAGVAESGAFTFVAPGSVTWSENSPAITVDQDGNVTGVAEGNAAVTATHTSGVSDSNQINVTPEGGARSEWTVMVYINASNDLYPYAPLDVDEMERIATNSQVRFVVQWKQVRGVGGNQNPSFSGTRRILVQQNNTQGVVSPVVEELGNVDMGRPETLNQFVRWTKENYPANRYALIVWNHGNGWMRSRDADPAVRGISYDDQTGNAIQIWQLPQAMQGERVDIFSFDACLMQMIEVQAELDEVCDFIVTSEENVPGYGYPYDRVFAPFMQNPGASTRDLTKAFVDGLVLYPPYSNDVITQSSVISARVPAVKAALDQLGSALIANRNEVATIVRNIRSTAMKYAFRGDGRFYYDLWDVANRLQNANTPQAVKSAAQAVKTAVDQAVAHEDHTAASNGSHGIAVDFSPSTEFNEATYDLLELARDTSWDEWLRVAP